MTNELHGLSAQPYSLLVRLAMDNQIGMSLHCMASLNICWQWQNICHQLWEVIEQHLPVVSLSLKSKGTSSLDNNLVGCSSNIHIRQTKMTSGQRSVPAFHHERYIKALCIDRDVLGQNWDIKNKNKTMGEQLEFQGTLWECLFRLS